MTLRIEKSFDGTSAVLHLAGEFKAQELSELAMHIKVSEPVVGLDLKGITGVDLAAVGFLVAREASGIALFHCPAYVREWMSLERERTKRDEKHSE